MSKVTSVFFFVWAEPARPMILIFNFFSFSFKHLKNKMANEYTKEDIERMRREMEGGGETAFDKIKRKMKDEPLVPAGKKYLFFDRFFFLLKSK